MIKVITKKNIFDSKASHIVVSCNMTGKHTEHSLLQQIESRFPYVYEKYQEVCSNGIVKQEKGSKDISRQPLKIGQILAVNTNNIESKDFPLQIIFVCLKKEPTDYALMNFFNLSFSNLETYIKEHGITELSMIALGTGSGKLKFDDTKKYYDKYLNDINFHSGKITTKCKITVYNNK